jgi:hypothetical protein
VRASGEVPFVRDDHSPGRDMPVVQVGGPGTLATVRRDWKAARAKVDSEGECRVCRNGLGLEAAHTIGRVHDPSNGKVRPVDIVPLCGTCHRRYDGRDLDLLPYLTHEEQAAAVEHVGIVGALRRISSDRDAATGGGG